MPVKFSVDDKIKIVFVFRKKNNKTCRKTTEIFNNRQSEKAIHV